MSNPWENLKGAPPSSTSSKSVSQSLSSSPISSSPISQQPISSQPIFASPTQPTIESTTQNTASSETSSAFSNVAPAKANNNRGTAIFLVALGLGLTIFDWYLRNSQGSYYVKLAVLGPFCAVSGLVGLAFPPSLDKDNPDGKIARIVSISLGIIAGGVNWYLLAN